MTFGKSESSSGTGSTTTSSSTTFALLGSGDTVLVGDLPAGETAMLTQDFIVSNDVSVVYIRSL